jgi:hypothetical protein
MTASGSRERLLSADEAIADLILGRRDKLQ